MAEPSQQPQVAFLLCPSQEAMVDGLKSVITPTDRLVANKSFGKRRVGHLFVVSSPYANGSLPALEMKSLGRQPRSERQSDALPGFRPAKQRGKDEHQGR